MSLNSNRLSRLSKNHIKAAAAPYGCGVTFRSRHPTATPMKFEIALPYADVAPPQTSPSVTGAIWSLDLRMATRRLRIDRDSKYFSICVKKAVRRQHGGERIAQMLPQCFNCTHFHTEGDKCDAYPTQRRYNCDAFPGPKREIPGDLLSNTVLHKTPCAGDHGILYDPIDPKISY